MILYRHIRLDKNEPFYIGIGNNIQRAYKKNGRNPIWQNIVKKTKYRVEIIFDNLDQYDAFQKEIEFISLYGRLINNSGTLANITIGGENLSGINNPNYNKGKKIEIDDVLYQSINDASRKLNKHYKTIKYRLESKNFPNYRKLYNEKIDPKFSQEEIKDIILNKKRGKNNGMFGKKHRVETKKIISEKNRKEVIVDSNQFMSIGHAANYLKVSTQSLSKSLNKNYKSKNKIVRYADINVYDEEFIKLYIEKFKKIDIYPNPELIKELKNL